MYFEYNLSTIACPKCQKNEDNLEVMRLHVFTSNISDRVPFYDIKCLCCHEEFPISTAFCTKKMT